MSERPFVDCGPFIVLEGADLSGKSTLARAVAAVLQKKKLNVLLTSEPTATPDGELIRKHLMGDAPPTKPERLQQRFATDRGDHLDNVIRPALAQGYTVVCDRYIPSSLAYGMAEGVDEQKIWKQNESYDLPDLVFISQITNEETKRRAAERGQVARLERFDKDPELLTRVRQNYWLLRDRTICKRLEDIVLLDGTLSESELRKQVLKAVYDHFRRLPGTPLWSGLDDEIEG